MMENIYPIRAIKTDLEILQCWEIASLLRPQLQKENWPSMISEMMQHERYYLSGIFDQDRIVSFAGFRHMTSLHSGNIIYIDDLYTLESHRGKKLASKLLAHVRAIAESTNKDALILDTDFTNNTAQKLYLRNGFQLAALHLSCDLRRR